MTVVDHDGAPAVEALQRAVAASTMDNVMPAIVDMQGACRASG